MPVDGLAMLGSVLGGAAGSNDPLAALRAKLAAQEEARQQQYRQQQGLQAGLAANRAANAAGPAAVQMAQRSPGYSYEYTPAMQALGAPAGQRYGVMAQDLERTPAGRSVVQRDPATEMRVVDTAGLTLQNTAAIGQLAREREEERREQEKRRSDERKALQAVHRRKRARDYEAAQASLRQQLDNLQSRIGY